MIRAFDFAQLCKPVLWCLVIFASIFPLPAQEVVYNNITSYLGQYETETREYGDQIHLTGTAREVTHFSFRYFGDFTATGSERAIIRFYANDRAYDAFRQQPGTLLYESGYFPINAGIQLKNLEVATPGGAVEVPDIFTFTVEFDGLGEGDAAGLLLYGPPAVGSSFNEYWIRTGDSRFDAVRYPGGEPRANFYALVVAVPEPGSIALFSAGAGCLFLFLRRKRVG